MVKITQDDIEKEKYKKKKLLEHVEEVEISEENKQYSVEKKIRDQRDEEVVDEGETRAENSQGSMIKDQRDTVAGRHLYQKLVLLFKEIKAFKKSEPDDGMRQIKHDELMAELMKLTACYR